MVTLLLLAQITIATPRPTPRTAPTPTPAVTPKPVAIAPAGGSSLSGFARGRKINTKAFSTPPASVDPETSSGAQQKSDSSAAVPESMSTEERQWRAQAEKIHRQIAEAREEADEERSRTGLPTPGMRDPQLELLRDAAAQKQLRKIEKLEKQLTQLAEECRKTAGCQPGWVR